ncbi:MAG: hypothetical protein JJU00_19230, partial [Opitutales bacterium]|nr:hypothetical protein [Opitutales bacterium]
RQCNRDGTIATFEPAIYFSKQSEPMSAWLLSLLSGGLYLIVLYPLYRYFPGLMRRSSGLEFAVPLSVTSALLFALEVVLSEFFSIRMSPEGRPLWVLYVAVPLLAWIAVAINALLKRRSKGSR